MNKEQKQEREYALRMVKESFPTLTLEQATKLQDKLYVAGCKAKRNAVALCNGDYEQDHYEQEHDKIRANLDKHLKKLGVTLDYHLGGDPRGYCLKAWLPNGAYNTWGGAEEGFGWGIE